MHAPRTQRSWSRRPANEFSARVFLIEANARKEIILSYSHELVRPGATYRVSDAGVAARRGNPPANTRGGARAA